MSDEEILAVKCSGCDCAIVPELHEATSGEFEMNFFVCPFCKKRYVVSITDAELRKNIDEYCRLKEANEQDRLSEKEQWRMAGLKETNRQRSLALKEALGYGEC